LTEARHVCAFFSSEEDGYRVLLPFIRDGFSHGEKAIHVLNPARRDMHLARLRAVGIDTDAALDSGQLEVRSNSDAYLPDGRFNQERMLALFEQLVSDTTRQGYRLSRIVCQMDWMPGGPEFAGSAMEFECLVNEILDRHDDAVICVYDLANCSGEMVIDAMRTHPIVIVGGTLQRNPFFVPPAQLLRERRGREQVREFPVA